MKHMKGILLFFAVIACFAISNVAAFPENAEFDSLFEKANTLYGEGKFDEAIIEYQKIISYGFESGSLYYNMGNCYFKKGNLGRALLCYEKARLLIPEDSDLRSNYEYARSKAVASSMPLKKIWFLRMADKAFENFSVNKLTIFMYVVYFVFILSILMRIFSRSFNKIFPFALIILAAVFILSGLALKDKITKIGAESIVVGEAVDVKFEPFDKATTFFQLNQGDNVIIIDQENGWRKIKRQDGKIGWVKSDNIEVI